jgi:hypothetical protein
MKMLKKYPLMDRLWRVATVLRYQTTSINRESPGALSWSKVAIATKQKESKIYYECEKILELLFDKHDTINLLTIEKT